MKKSGILAAASMAAASATAISSSPSSSPPSTSSTKHRDNYVASADKFAPRFDGLRFIEPLVTAHR
ncbi:hypothetical protein CsSME_00030003 [Camellia sinensis var. sinensis]